MFSSMLEAELSARLGPGAAHAYSQQKKWAAIRANARRIALEEYRWWGNGTRIENEPITAGRESVANRLLDYWKVAKAMPPQDVPFWATPWSAVFISYVLHKAGTGSNFRYAPAHREYVYWAVQNATKNPTHPVKAVPVTAQPPRVGDLVCNWRASTPVTIAELAQMVPPLPRYPLHCDIVTEVEPTRIWVVGGNKTPVGGAAACPPGQDGCTVNRTKVALENGLLKTLPGTKSGWLAIIRIGP